MSYVISITFNRLKRSYFCTECHPSVVMARDFDDSLFYYKYLLVGSIKVSLENLKLKIHTKKKLNIKKKIYFVSRIGYIFIKLYNINIKLVYDKGSNK